jgi:hypothetical protein
MVKLPVKKLTIELLVKEYVASGEFIPGNGLLDTSSAYLRRMKQGNIHRPIYILYRNRNNPPYQRRYH